MSSSQLEKVASLVRSTGAASPAAMREARELVFGESVEVFGVQCHREDESLGLRWTWRGGSGLRVSVFRPFLSRLWNVSVSHSAGSIVWGRGKTLGVAVDEIEHRLFAMLSAIGSALDSPVASPVPAAAKETDDEQ